MKLRTRLSFTTITTEGSILPADLLDRVADLTQTLEGRSDAAYHLAPGERLNEAFTRSWNRAQAAWRQFETARALITESDPGTTVTRERWLLPLFAELGYGRLVGQKAIEVAGRSFPVSHGWDHTPIHLVGFRVDLDKRTAGVAGAAKMSPHGMVQELLNASDEHLWGFVSNGLKLRILRDNSSLTRQAFVEFDLEAMMNGEAFADFALLWLLCHQSSVEGERPEECRLEKWSRIATDQGTRALEHLRKGVEEAIEALGRGFLRHPANRDLRSSLQNGSLTPQDYYRQTLRLVYRMLFLFVAEDRDLLLLPDASDNAKANYNRYYSVSRLRDLAARRTGTRHADLYAALQLVMTKLGEGGCPELGLPELGSFLWSRKAIGDIGAPVDPAQTPCALENYDLLEAVRALAYTRQGDLLRRISYKNLGTEELGSVYESLLERHPQINVDAHTFALATAGGNERKTSGSYYTPSSLVSCLLDTALDPVLDEAAKKPNPAQAILDLKVCDPACGSGHFLIAAAHRIAKRLATVRTGNDEPAPTEVRHALREVIGHCIYGVDLNPMSVELCKVALWMEALEPGKPLSFLDHHIQCGNSLLGTTPALLANGIPDEAFTAIEGDDKKTCSAYKKRNKEERKAHLAGQTALNFGGPWDYLGNLPTAIASLEKAPDDTPDAIRDLETRYAKFVDSSDYRNAWFLADLWCSAFVWKKTDDQPFIITEKRFRDAEKNPHTADQYIRQETARLRDQYKFFHWHLAFPTVFRVPANGETADNEQCGWKGGFACMLGNPPWEHTELKEKEWFASVRPDIALAATGAIRRDLIEELAQDSPEIHAAFLAEHRMHDAVGHMATNSGYYPLCGRGRVNTYAIFTELMSNLRSKAGAVGVIIPSGIATDDTTKLFFQSMVDGRYLYSLYDFENRKNFFPNVHSSLKFCLFTASGVRRSAKNASFAFFLHSVDDLRDPNRVFALSSDEISLLSPNTRTCSVFRTRRDADLNISVYRKFPVLINDTQINGNSWDISFKQGLFNMSADSEVFFSYSDLEKDGWQLSTNVFKKNSGRYLPLYESKMIGQFDHRAASVVLSSTAVARQGQSEAIDDLEHQNPSLLPIPRSWVSQSTVEDAIPSLWPYDWLVGWRDVTSATNERTVISSFIPRSAVGHTFLLMFPQGTTASASSLIVANLNSFCFDYMARQQVTGLHLSYNIFKQLPVLQYGVYSGTCDWSLVTTIEEWILPRVLELSYTAHDLENYARDCKYFNSPFLWDVNRRFLIRCELDAAYFHLYGIARDDVDYIMDTFSIVKRRDEKDHGEFLTKRTILEIYDEMVEASSSGSEYQTWLNPPPANGWTAS